MLRVLLKVDHVNIRIKQTVNLYILIRKGDKTITHCRKEPLLNGQLTLLQSTEFFVAQTSPSFSIELYLSLGTIKKYGGEVPIDLSEFPINASNRKIAQIQKSPQQSSTIEFDFVYMLSDYPLRTDLLIGQTQIQSINHKAYLNRMAKSNQQLISEKNKLEDEIKQLKCKNEELYGENKMIEEDINLQREEHKAEIKDLRQEKNSTLETLEKEKQKIAEIVDLINESGNSQLISQAEHIILGHSQK